MEFSGHPIVGTWRLTSFTEENLETGAVSYPFGVGARAFVIYAANGYVAAIFADDDRRAAAQKRIPGPVLSAFDAFKQIGGRAVVNFRKGGNGGFEIGENLFVQRNQVPP